MSDGPYKTLPMRRPWRALGKRAYLPAFSPAEVLEALLPALRNDWQTEVSPGFVRTLADLLRADADGSFLPHQTETDLHALRRQCGSALEASLVVSVCDALAEGTTGQAALEQGIEASLESRSLSSFRQMEEHCAREGKPARATDMRHRLEQSLAGRSLREFAKSLALGATPAGSATPMKQGGLDDGVTL